MNTPSPQEMYVHWSFPDKDWAAAAERYLQLCQALGEREAEDGEIDHDLLADFESCDLCDEITELIDLRDAFTGRFAAEWARQALIVSRAGCP